MATNIWSDREEKFLRDNYVKMSCREIGKKLGRTKFAVQKKATKLNLKKYKRPEYMPQKREEEGRHKMQEFKMEKEVGDMIKIRIKDRCARKPRIVKGKIIFKNNKMITLEGDHYKESFSFAEFHTGQALIL